MAIEELILRYGYLMLFFGSFIEGEIFLIIAGFLVHQGYFLFSAAILFAFLGAFLGDLFYFYLGRTHLKNFISKSRHLKRYSKKINRLLRKYRRFDIPFILGLRFIYGTRIWSSIVLGTTHVKSKKFVTLNFISSLSWAIIFISIGYSFGEIVARIFGRIRHFELGIIVGIIMLGLIIAILHPIISYFKEEGFS